MATMKLNQAQTAILEYILSNVIRDMEYVDDQGKWCDCGGIICCLDDDEFNELKKIQKML